MGERGKEITAEKAEKVVESLRAMFAYEWLEIYYFLTASWRMTDFAGKRVAKFFREEGLQDLKSVEKIAKRILELGGELPLNFDEVVSIASQHYPHNLPERDNTIGHLEQILKFERQEIAFLQSLCSETFGKDDVSFMLFSELLQDEVGDEHKWQQLLKKEGG